MSDTYDEGFDEGYAQGGRFMEAMYAPLVEAVEDYVELWPDSDIASLIRALREVK